MTKPRDPLITLSLVLCCVIPLFFFAQVERGAEDQVLLAYQQRMMEIDAIAQQFTPVPDFASINPIPERKQAFFAAFERLALLESAKLIAARRVVLASVEDLDEGGLSPQRLSFLEDLLLRYGVDSASKEGATDLFQANSLQDQALLDELLERLDVIPPSLVLVQAAIESAWGTSRFSVEANNYFGQWCFSRGCGLVPRQRAEGSVHEVRRFESAQSSVAEYMRNLNTHAAYRSFRKLRATQRSQGEALTGSDLAGELRRYSELGERYVKLLRSMIRSNQLASIDKQFQQEPLLALPGT